MAIVSVPVWSNHYRSGLLSTIAEIYTGKKDRWGWPIYRRITKVSKEFIKKDFNDKDTYLVVFGPSQASEMKLFKRAFKKHIIYEAPKSTNSNHPGTGPRNTLFIFEKCE